MAQEEKDITPEQLEKRLDEIFGGGQQEQEEEGEQQGSVLDRLDSLVLTLDWEISDETVSSFLSEASSLQETFSGDKVASGLLRLLVSLGKYIQKRKGKSHPEAVNLLQAAYADLNHYVSSGELSDKEKKQLLVRNVERYNELKSKISSGRSAETSEAAATAQEPQPEKPAEPAQEPEPERTAEPDPSQSYAGEPEIAGAAEEAQAPRGEQISREVPASAVSGEVSNKALLEAVEDLKDLIREEFQILRREIRSREK